MSGYKTYFVAVAMVLYGVALIIQGQQEQGVRIIMEALGLATLRAGVSKSGLGG